MVVVVAVVASVVAVIVVVDDAAGTVNPVINHLLPSAASPA